MRHVIQIVPPPGGVSDYALRLAEGFREQHDIHTVFLSSAPEHAKPCGQDAWPTVSVCGRIARNFHEALISAARRRACSAVILHLSGYGYAKRGAPFWLLNGMRKWRRRNPSARLIVVFHELYARGNPWNSSFWMGPLQKYIAREIWGLADWALTTTVLYRDQLALWRPDAADRIVLMPVFSNVGEPREIPSPGDRAPKAVVFGSAGLEKLLYENYAGEMMEAVRELGIREIVDIGARLHPVPTELAGASVTCLGRQSAEEISRRLLECRFGFITYDLTRLGKSTIFAAYAAQGVIPVCFSMPTPICGGLRAGTHLLQPPVGAPKPEALSAIQEKLTGWYRAHSQARVAEAVAAMCGSAA